jgi:adenine-specific DNA methylase
MNNDKRLIELAFPLKQTSIDSVHEKNVRHGHISTLHIWPARRPLAASRAALIATLLPDPGDKEKRDEILKRLGGTLKKTLKKKKMPNGRIEEIEAWETEGGVLRWGRETSPDMDWFRAEIRKAYGGRAPRVLDPFAGGGAIPLEAMRLGCEATAIDINPVAWFILRCTLEYPQKLAGVRRRLPDFALQDVAFLTDYFKARGLKLKDAERRARQVAGRAQAARHENGELFALPDVDAAELDADLAWHVRAWGRWVLQRARRELAHFYPTYAEFCSLKPYRRVSLDTDEPLKLVPVNDAGEPQVELLNAGFEPAYLDNPANPRWVMKPTVAYLWARTVACKACRAELPLLKTRWLAKKDDKRVLLTMQPNPDRTGIVFGIDASPPVKGGNAAQKREHDKKLGAGTMSRAGARCPCCGTIMTMEDLRLEGRAGRMWAVMTAVVVDGPQGKEYRLPTVHEIERARAAEAELARVFAEVPFGLPEEPITEDAKRNTWCVQYGVEQWRKLFTPRQLLALGVFVRAVRAVWQEPTLADATWREAVGAYLATAISKIADRGSTVCSWTVGWDKVRNTFARFALPMTWDFAEAAAMEETSGGFPGAVEWAARYIEHALTAAHGQAQALNASAIHIPPSPASGRGTGGEGYDLVVTDPPYYDAIGYSVLMDFFYVWLRRTLWGLSPAYDAAFAAPLAPKWDREKNDGELIDDASRFGGDKAASKKNYEDGMARAFAACQAALAPEGRLVIVFAHKQPDAWETLVSAIIRAGFVVDGSWPIQTEMGNRMRAMASAALASSVWLVCKKRDPSARAGWDTQVLKEMQANITQRLRAFWDAGIRGPDFIWAATGPALEAYSRYPAVKKASEPGALMSVTDFLGHVRRIVVDFVVGRVLSHGQSEPTPGDHPLDDVTTYYLLHRNDFGLKEAPAGPCILYAVSCGLSERELVDQYELLAKSGGAQADDDDEPSGDDEEGDAEETLSSGGGGKYKLKDWRARKHRTLGVESASGRAIPLIDQVHKLMQLWVAGDVVKVNDYLDRRGLRRSPIFAQLIQALIEQSRAEGCAEECSILERLQNYLRSLGSAAQYDLALGG